MALSRWVWPNLTRGALMFLSTMASVWAPACPLSCLGIAAQRMELITPARPRPAKRRTQHTRQHSAMKLVFALCLLVAGANAVRIAPGAAPTMTVEAPAKRVLQSYGSGSTTFNVNIKSEKGSTLTAFRSVGIDEMKATSIGVRTATLADGNNGTMNIETDGRLGFTSFRILAQVGRGLHSQRISSPASLDVVGVQLSHSGRMAGGDNGEKIVIPHGTRSVKLDGIVYAGRGLPSVKLADCVARVTEAGVAVPKFLTKDLVKLSGNTATLSPDWTASSSRGVRIGFECPSVVVDGETAETHVDVVPGP